MGNKSRRILYLKEEVRRGSGDSHYLVAQAKALAARGHYQCVVTGKTDFEEELASFGVKVYLAPLDNHAKGLANAIRSYRTIRDVARRERIDILHAHHRWPGLIGWLASRRLGLPIVSTDHAVLLRHRYTSFRGEAVVAVSEDNRRHLREFFHIPEERIFVVGGFTHLPEPASPEEIAGVRLELGIPESAQCIGQVAQLQPVKNQRLLLEAFARLRQTHPNVHVLMVGDGPLEQELRALAESLGIADHTHWLGLRSDIARLLGAMDVFVLTSHQEAFGLAVIEAMNLEVPVVCTDVGGLPHVLDGGRAGVLAPAGDAAAIAVEIGRLLDDSARRKTLGTAGKQRVNEIVDLDALAQEVEVAYDYACSARLHRGGGTR